MHASEDTKDILLEKLMAVENESIIVVVAQQ